MAREGKLVGIANGMRRSLEAAPAGWRLTPLAQGLQVLMQRMDGQWRLAMAREGVYPSDTEVEVCREAFRVPAGAAEQRMVKHRRNPKTNRVVAWHVVELRWREPEVA